MAAFVHIYWLKAILAMFLLALYGVYVYRTLQIAHVPDAEFDLEPLMLAPKRPEPATGMILLQTFLGLAGILVLAHLFVQQIHHLSTQLGISPLFLSLLITPIATELPEKFNSVVWIAKKKDNLALGNITGAMVFHSCVLTAIGLLFTPWILDKQGILSVFLCFLSAGTIYVTVMIRRMLSARMLWVGGLCYLVFLVYSVMQLPVFR